MTKIFVGNLPWRCSSEDLEKLFRDHGEVISAEIVTDRETGRSRGFGFVEMQSSDEADDAINALNGADYQGRSLTVNVARSRQGSGPPRRGGGGPGGPRH